MGNDAEIFKRLGELEVSVGKLLTDVAWLKKFSVMMFGAGGLVGAAITVLFTR